jgi:hypothetical protein
LKFKKKFYLLISFIVLLIISTLVSAQTVISNCQTLNTPGELYLLDSDIDDHSGSNCMIIGAEGVTLDCDGHYIDGVGSNSAIYNNGGYNNFTLKNCEIKEFQYGMYILTSAVNGLNITDTSIHTTTIGISSSMTITNLNINNLNSSSNTQYGMRTSSAVTGLNINSSNFSKNTLDGLYMSTWSGGIIENSYFNDNTQYGIYINRPINNVNFSNNKIEGNSQSGFVFSNTGTDGFSENNYFKNNTIRYNSQYGLYLHANTVGRNFKNNYFSENEVYSNANKDIYLVNFAQENIFWNNTFDTPLMLYTSEGYTNYWNDSITGNDWLMFNSDEQGCFDDSGHCTVPVTIDSNNIDYLPQYKEATSSKK